MNWTYLTEGYPPNEDTVLIAYEYLGNSYVMEGMWRERRGEWRWYRDYGMPLEDSATPYAWTALPEAPPLPENFLSNELADTTDQPRYGSPPKNSGG